MAAPTDPRLSVAPSTTDDSHQPTTATSTTGSSNGAQSTSPRVHAVGSDYDNVDKAKRKRQPRNSACQSCAALKMKCIATPTPGVCERCSRMSRDCIPAIPKPRKRRATDGFESKGIPLADLLENGSPQSEVYRTSPRALLKDDPSGPEVTSRSFNHSFARGLALDDRSADYYLHGVDHNYVRQCCSAFTKMADKFPFVTVPTSDPTTLVSHRPATTAAICIAASASRPEIRSRLSEAFRQCLSTRCIMEGERSLDLMVGLLIYLAWHHHYYKKQNIYQQLFLLAGMATDLGLQKIPSLAEQARGIPDLESQRAFIGVYYLTTSLALMGFSKPVPLSWSPSLDHFASSLYSTSSREVNLQPYIDLAHLLADHEQLMAAAPRVQSASYIDLATKSALSRIKTLKRVHPSASSIPAYTAVTIHINSRALTASASMHIPGSALMQTAVALKDYFDELLLRPPSSMHQIALADWTNLLEVLVLTTRLASPHFLSSISKMAGGGLGWESSTLSTILQPDVVLDTVCSHMAAVEDVQHRHELLIGWLQGLCESMKRRILHERNGGDESCYDTIVDLNRGRNGSIVGLQEGRFRAVNAEPRSANAVSRPAWSPRGVHDFTFDIFGGGGLLDESFWTTYS